MRISKKLAVIAASGIASVSIAGGAFAYFTAPGTASTSTTVGNESPWRIDHVVVSGNGGVLLPAGGQQAIDYVVTNDGMGVEHLNNVTVTVKPDAVDPTSVSGAPGCLVSWFDILNSWPGSVFAPIGSYTHLASRPGHAVIGMNNNGDVNQDVCKGKNIPLLISAS